MSDEKTEVLVPPEEMPRITFDEFVAFLNEKTESNKCPACGRDNWTISTTDDGNDVNVIQSRFLYKPELALWSLFVSCDNCGNTRLFNYTTVLQWVMGRKETFANVPEGK